MTEKLPQKIYVVRKEEDGGEYTWYSAEEELETLAEQGETRIVGVYELVKKVSLSLEIKSEVIVEDVEE